ncbi:MAG: hypothetical protein Q7J38_16795, partial [Gallionella sp.]|nr:hypothetical protein [Gallionella sp.]
GGADVLTAVNDVAAITLTDTTFDRTGMGQLTLAAIGTANLTGGVGVNNFTVTGWTGTGTLDGLASSDTITGANLTYNLTGLDQGNNGAGFSWSLIENLTATGTSTINGVGGTGSLSGNINSAATTLSGIITTTGSQDYTGTVTLAANTTLAGTIVTFGNTVNATTGGTEALVVTGNVVLNNTVGNTQNLGAISVSGTTTFNAGATSVKTSSAANTGNQTYTGQVFATAPASLSLTGTTLNNGVIPAGTITATNALNDFTGPVTVTGAAVSLTDANALTVTTGAGAVTGLLTTTSGTTTTLGALTVGSLTATALNTGVAANAITQTGGAVLTTTNALGNVILTAGAAAGANIAAVNAGNGGNILLASNNVLAGGISATVKQGTTGVIGSGNAVAITADRIAVMQRAGGVIGTGGVPGAGFAAGTGDITAARVTLKSTSGGAGFITGAGMGYINANAPEDTSNATYGLTLDTTVGAVAPVGNGTDPLNNGLFVNMPGSVLLLTNAAPAEGSVYLSGAQNTVFYQYASDFTKRTVFYNGVAPSSSQFSGALDAAYTENRESTREIRESGFSKENAAKLLRTSTIVAAGPGQAAVDDNLGMSSSAKCDGSLKGDSLACE